jgi:hypothetical protein
MPRPALMSSSGTLASARQYHLTNISSTALCCQSPSFLRGRGGVALQNNLSGFRKLILVMVFLIKGCESRCPRRSTYRFFIPYIFNEEKICTQISFPVSVCHIIVVCVRVHLSSVWRAASCCCARLDVLCCADAHVLVATSASHNLSCCTDAYYSEKDRVSIEDSHLGLSPWSPFCL